MERLNREKAAAIDYGLNRFDWQALEAAAQAARLIEGAPAAAVLRAWRQAWERDPSQAAEDEAAGGEYERVGELLARVAAGLPGGKGCGVSRAWEALDQPATEARINGAAAGVRAEAR